MEILSGKQANALKTVIYGPEGIGKSTFAAAFPEPLFIDTEDSTKFMDVRRFRKPQSWAELLEQVRYARDTPGLCRTLVLDTADWAEQLCSDSICASKKLSGIEDIGYGKGYVYLVEDFGKLLNLLGELTGKGINAVLTAHAAMRKFEQPDELGAYDRWELKLQKKTAALVKEWSDLLLFANYKTMSVAVDKDGKRHKAQGGKRVMYTTHHPCWDAKNRQGLPEEMPLDFRAIAPYLFPAEPAPAPKPEPRAATEPDPPPTPSPADKPTPPLPASDLPAKLIPLLKSADVTETEVREIIANKGYFTIDTAWPVMEQAGFIDGWLLPWWDKIVTMIRENPDRLPL
jgi:hypothetical protein